MGSDHGSRLGLRGVGETPVELGWSRHQNLLDPCPGAAPGAAGHLLVLLAGGLLSAGLSRPGERMKLLRPSLGLGVSWESFTYRFPYI